MWGEREEAKSERLAETGSKEREEEVERGEKDKNGNRERKESGTQRRTG